MEGLTGFWVAVLGLALEIVAFIVIGVWVVSSIKASTQALGIHIEHLAESVNRLNSWLGVVDKKVDKHGERIATLEAERKE